MEQPVVALDIQAVRSSQRSFGMRALLLRYFGLEALVRRDLVIAAERSEDQGE